MWITIFRLYWNFSDNIVFQEQKFYEKTPQLSICCQNKFNLFDQLEKKHLKFLIAFSNPFMAIHKSKLLSETIELQKKKKLSEKLKGSIRWRAYLTTKKKINLRRYWSLKWSLTQVTKLYYFERNCEFWLYVAMSRWIPARKKKVRLNFLLWCAE